MAKQRFHTIRIDVQTDVGESMNFEGEKVFVEIDFRKCVDIESFHLKSRHGSTKSVR